MHILAVGDLYQLPPVCQLHLFDLVTDGYIRLHKSGSLWRDEFTLCKLTKIMTQKDDATFAELLCRVREANCTKADIALLQTVLFLKKYVLVGASHVHMLTIVQKMHFMYIR